MYKYIISLFLLENEIPFLALKFFVLRRCTFTVLFFLITLKDKPQCRVWAVPVSLTSASISSENTGPPSLTAHAPRCFWQQKALREN